MTVRPIRPAQVRGRVRAPPSKSYTHRALVAAFLSVHGCEVANPLVSDDTVATRDGLRALGAEVRVNRAGWTVVPPKKKRTSRPRTVHCGESGTTLRFLAALAALQGEPVRFEGSSGLAARPMGELYGALRQLGAGVRPASTTHALPCTIQGPIVSGFVPIRGDVSSQFVSALLLTLPTLVGPSRIQILGSRVSEPYIDATCAMIRERGVQIQAVRGGYQVPGGQRYRAGRIRVPGDASSAAYLWAAAAATGGQVDVEGISRELPQADLAILPILSKMGARVGYTARQIRVSGPLSRPISVDLTDSPDLFPLVSVLAARVPDGRSLLVGAPQIEFKESNRRVQSVRLARAAGAKVVELPQRIEVIGTASRPPLHLPSLSDHRLVMSAAVAALSGTGTSRIGRTEAVTKSFPGFWRTIQGLSARGDVAR
jgi:3-phosphoshikimate 1-carboxyvinyltransferase